MARKLTSADAADAVRLYQDLTRSVALRDDPAGRARFQEILDHPGTSIWGAERDGHIVSMCTIHILPNMTFSGRPYALIENVMPQKEHRQTGCARAVMQAAIAEAWAADCYKIMVLTSQARGAKGFYEAVGFSDVDKFG